MRVALLSLLVFVAQWAWSQIDREFFLIARNTGEKVMANNDTIRVFGFAENLNQQPSVPGPTMYMNEGDSVKIDVWNVSQGAPHTIHLHGLDVDQQNDGVPHLSFEIPHMEHGYYYLKAPHAGTYLYHCHVASTVHVQAGMYGLIVVRPSDGTNATWNGGIAYEREYAFMTSEIDTVWHQDSVLNHGHGPGSAPVQIPVYSPQFYLVNGSSDEQLKANKVRVRCLTNNKTYLRFANIGFYSNRIMFPPELNAEIVATDGRPLPSAEKSDSLDIYPGERYGVLIDPQQMLSDSMAIQYRDLNTGLLKNVQHFEVLVQDVIAVEERETTMTIYPNPAQDMLHFRLSDPSLKMLSVQLFDQQGQKLWSSGILSSEGLLKLPELAQGVYSVQIFSEGQWVASKTFVKVDR